VCSEFFSQNGAIRNFLCVFKGFTWNFTSFPYHTLSEQRKMSLSPQKVDFNTVWARLVDGVSKIITLTGVKGMPMYE
jgi:hypothetical protein